MIFNINIINVACQYQPSHASYSHIGPDIGCILYPSQPDVNIYQNRSISQTMARILVPIGIGRLQYGIYVSMLPEQMRD